jgi:hypothetical protein
MKIIVVLKLCTHAAVFIVLISVPVAHMWRTNIEAHKWLEIYVPLFCSVLVVTWIAAEGGEPASGVRSVDNMVIYFNVITVESIYYF